MAQEGLYKQSWYFLGPFTLNLNLPFPAPVENLKGANHDVNSAPFPVAR